MSENKKVYAQGLYDPQVKILNVKGKEVSLIKLAFNVEKFTAFLKEHSDAKGIVKIDCWEREEEGKFGGTHSAVLNDWRPNKQENDDPFA